MSVPGVHADFHNADEQGRLRLNGTGTLRDLAQQQVQLREGPVLSLHADDADDQGRPGELRAEGIVEYAADERCWVARIDGSAIHPASEPHGTSANDASAGAAVGRERPA